MHQGQRLSFLTPALSGDVESLLCLYPTVLLIKSQLVGNEQLTENHLSQMEKCKLDNAGVSC
jgi:hypothetical protein